ncbi:MAG TPA: GNAT family N-acetyltransferase [Terriglobia bacterium]|nr:GNAT family N-acetyltransferase [Terriglobia bacterium]
MAEETMVLRSPRLILRPWRDSDLPAIARLNADPRVMEFLPNCLDRAASDAMVTRMQAAIETQGFGFWAVEAPGTADFIGFVGLNRPSFAAAFMPCVEIGWRLAHDFWGRGYATEAARAALRYGFGDLGLAEIVSFTAVINLRSQRVMQRLGMQHYRAEDFDHPALPEGHRLRRHVLYRMTRMRWSQMETRGA